MTAGNGPSNTTLTAPLEDDSAEHLRMLLRPIGATRQLELSVMQFNGQNFTNKLWDLSNTVAVRIVPDIACAVYAVMRPFIIETCNV